MEQCERIGVSILIDQLAQLLTEVDHLQTSHALHAGCLMRAAGLFATEVSRHLHRPVPLRIDVGGPTGAVHLAPGGLMNPLSPLSQAES
jgi:hypothetical protein